MRIANRSAGDSRSVFVAASWTGQLVSVVCGVLLPIALAPADYALLFQLRQIHLLGYFTFAFVLQAAVLELGLARGRGAITVEKPLQHVALGSVLLFSTAACVVLILGCRIAIPGMSHLAWIGVLSFSALLPLLGVIGWANSVLLAMKRFDLLGRLVLVHASGVSVGGLIGAGVAGLPGAIAGTGAGQVVAALFGMALCRSQGALGVRLEWSIVRELAVVGVPQSLVALVALASRTLDRNFAYLGYGEGAGGVFGIAATFSLNAIALAAALAETSRATINEESGAFGDKAPGTHLVGDTLRTWLLMLGVAVLGSLSLPLIYGLMFPKYLLIRADAIVLAALALWAACPVALCFHSNMYLVATRRPALYLIPHVICLSLMIAGNAVGLWLDWGLLGIVAVGGASNVALALLSLLLAARHHPALRAGSRRILAFAFATTAAALLATLVLHRAATWLAARGSASVAVTLFSAAAFIVLYAAAAWLLERREGIARRSDASGGEGAAPGSAAQLVSVVIPCRDRPELLEGCLDALSSQIDSGPCEVIVVDSSSSDHIQRVIAQHANVHRVGAPAPLGPGEARNLGALHSHGNTLAFIDADCLAAPGWLASARMSLARGTRIAGGAILDQRPWSPIAAAGHFMLLSEYGPARQAGSVTRLTGAHLVMQRSTFEDLRGFPPGPGEDIRFTTAAHQRWPEQVRFESAMVIRHASRSELRAFWKRCRQLGNDRAKTGPAPSVIARLGPSTASAFVASAARVAYISWCTARWHPRSLPRFLLLSPIVALGCLRWGLGIRDGYARPEGSP